MNNSTLWIRDQAGRYSLSAPASPDEVCHQAAEIVLEKMMRGDKFNNPSAVGQFLSYEIGYLEHEVFVCLFLDTKQQLLRFESLFNGTVNGASVYPREVAKRALALNATGLICGHNHPSGDPELSLADTKITHRLRDALKLIDVTLHDHIVVAGMESVSMAERGIL